MRITFERQQTKVTFDLTPVFVMFIISTSFTSLQMM